VTISVVIPFQSDPTQRHRPVRLADGASREDIFDWVFARWSDLCPEFDFVSASSTSPIINRSQARNRAVAQSSGDIIIIADADIVFHRRQIDVALQYIAVGAEWVVGFNRYEQLTGPDTRTVLAQNPRSPVLRFPSPRWSTDQGNAGLMVLTRAAFYEVGGYDERFSGYGWEDWAFANALSTLVHPLVAVPDFVLHLCHPRVSTRNSDKRKMKPLFDPYDDAMSNPEAMRAIVDNPARRLT